MVDVDAPDGVEFEQIGISDDELKKIANQILDRRIAAVKSVPFEERQWLPNVFRHRDITKLIEVSNNALFVNILPQKEAREAVKRKRDFGSAFPGLYRTDGDACFLAEEAINTAINSHPHMSTASIHQAKGFVCVGPNASMTVCNFKINYVDRFAPPISYMCNVLYLIGFGNKLPREAAGDALDLLVTKSFQMWKQAATREQDAS